MRLPFFNRRISPLYPIGLLTCILLILLVLFIPPTAQLRLPFLTVTAVFPLLVLSFLLFFAIGTLVFTSRFHGFLLSSCVIAVLLLRLNGLKHPLFVVLVIALFIALEFFFSSAGKKSASPTPRHDQLKK